MLFRVLVLLLLLVLGGTTAFDQRRDHRWWPKPVDVRNVSAPKSRVPEAERMLEADFRRRIDLVAKEWNQ